MCAVPQPAEWFLSGSTGALLVVAVAVLRIYLGWAYVGNRLLSASVEYEETGWWVSCSSLIPHAASMHACIMPAWCAAVSYRADRM